jgi:hypothetical protein
VLNEINPDLIHEPVDGLADGDSHVGCRIRPDMKNYSHVIVNLLLRGRVCNTFARDARL